jgi:transcriptional regulator
MKPTRTPDLLRGTLDMMILKALSLGPTHGHGVARRIHAISGDVLDTQEGSLYPALHRLLARGDVSASWKQSESNRRARFYSLTASGRRRLTREQSTWRQMRDAIDSVMNTRRLPEGEVG